MKKIPDAAAHPSRLARDFFELARHHHNDMLAELQGVPSGTEHLVIADLDIGAISGATVDVDKPRQMWRQMMHSGDEAATAIMICASLLVTKVAAMASEDNAEAFGRIQRAREQHGRWTCIADLNSPHVSVGLVSEQGFDEIARFRNPGALN